jgi:hypothetical protein
LACGLEELAGAPDHTELSDCQMRQFHDRNIGLLVGRDTPTMHDKQNYTGFCRICQVVGVSHRYVRITSSRRDVVYVISNVRFVRMAAKPCAARPSQSTVWSLSRRLLVVDP